MAMEDVQQLLASEAFAEVKAAVEAMPPEVLLDPLVGAHLRAIGVGMGNLAGVAFPVPDEPEE